MDGAGAALGIRGMRPGRVERRSIPIVLVFFAHFLPPLSSSPMLAGRQHLLRCFRSHPLSGVQTLGVRKLAEGVRYWVLAEMCS